MAKQDSSQSSAFISVSLGVEEPFEGMRVRGAAAAGGLESDPTMLHPRWVIDSPVMQEPMKFAVTRYLSRLAGQILKETTASEEQARAKLEVMVGSKLPLSHLVPLINMTVDVLNDRNLTGLSDATEKVQAAWESTLAPVPITSDDALRLLVAVNEQSCRSMLAELFQPPKAGPGMTRIGQKDLDCMSTVFGQQGNIESIYIALTRGRLSKVLREALGHAQDEYQALDLRMRSRGIAESVSCAAARVDLRELGSDKSKHSVFKITPEGFKDAYIKASFEYVLKYARGLPPKGGES
jgi:hypothetical protein